MELSGILTVQAVCVFSCIKRNVNSNLSVIFIYIHTFNFNRQGAEHQPICCPADREDLDKDRVSNFILGKFSDQFMSEYDP